MRRPLLLCLPLLALPASAQIASRVLDINTSRYDTPWPSAGTFGHLEAAGDSLYMEAPGGVWVSDGTSLGTELLRDLCPGPCAENSRLLGRLGKLMLWTSDLDPSRRQLWRSDGTRPGTFALTGPELDAGRAGSDLDALDTVFRNELYFVGCSGPSGDRDCELWRTDGTAAGTRVVHEAPRDISWMHVAGDRLYYRADDGQGSDLWVTDGTAAGTVLLRRFEIQYDRPHSPASVGRRLFFIVWEGEGEEVWTSDGTAAGTRAVTSFPGPRPFESSGWLKAAGNHVYFVADDVLHAREIWRTDGTAAGTVRMTEFGYDSPFESTPSSLAVVGGTLIFQATDGLSPSRLWTSRGTPGSTAPLPTPCADCGTDVYSRLVESGGKAYYIAEDGLWVTDGTASGTRRVNDLCGSCSSRELLPWHGGVLFVPDDTRHPEIWFSDGTAAGTKRVAGSDGNGSVITPLEVAEVGGKLYFLAEVDDAGSLWVAESPGSSRPVFTLPVTGPSSDPRRLAAMGDRVVFTAWDGQDFSGLWSSAGTPESTAPVGPVPPDVPWYEASDFVRAAGLLFFQVGSTYEEHDLWRTDGTAQGTIHLAHLPARAAMAPFQGALYLFAGQEIWRTDGTVAGTVKTGTYPEDLEVVESATPGPNGLYLKTVTAPYKTELWFSDGTTAGTRQFTSFNSGGVGGGDVELATLGPWVYYSWDFKLWRTDGTPSGTTPVDVPFQNAFPTKLLAHQGALYFFIHGPAPAQRLQLWRTDGTGAGTVQLAELAYQDTYYFPLKLTPFAGRLFFNVDDGVHGIELWATDGTAAGTALVKDLFPGPRSSKPTQLTVAGGRLFFAAGDDVHGIELWQSDGTAAGTRLVHDIAPQTESSSPEQLTVAGDKLFFTADDRLTGRELWVLPLASAPTGCVPSATRLCLNGGRYEVEAAWRVFRGERGVGKAMPLTADTGWFWFFGPDNVEVVLKVLDGRGLNDHVWVFYGALSNVEYTLTVTDTQTGLTRRYLNPSGQLASVGDTRAFGPLGAASRTDDASVAPPSPPVRAEKTAAASAACQADARRLCLNGGRFAVEASWKDFQGKIGSGTAVALTGDTGYFWFFDAANVEVVLKVLDGTPVNGRHWVFYGALSNVEYTLTVTDTTTGKKNVYRNPSGRFASVADTGAF